MNRIYMYTRYERFWHWIQALTVLVLLETGWAIHSTAGFHLFSFETSVLIHNILGFVLLTNAFLGVFYHIATGAIRQYKIQRTHFMTHSIAQVKFYLKGIFRGDAHPFAKNRQNKLNPLQKVTYVAILGVLGPLQIATGLLIWGAQQWPLVDSVFGGLRIIAYVHTLGSWIFAAFVLLHIYLATTSGHTIMASIKAIMIGWEDIHEFEKAAARKEAMK